MTLKEAFALWFKFCAISLPFTLIPVALVPDEFWSILGVVAVAYLIFLAIILWVRFLDKMGWL